MLGGIKPVGTGSSILTEEKVPLEPCGWGRGQAPLSRFGRECQATVRAKHGCRPGMPLTPCVGGGLWDQLSTSSVGVSPKDSCGNHFDNLWGEVQQSSNEHEREVKHKGGWAGKRPKFSALIMRFTFVTNLMILLCYHLSRR